MIIMENKIKHLEMIQGVITRMANNSFLLKGWAVTLLAGIFVLAGRDMNGLYFLIAYVPIIAFWFLDSYYLLQEKLFRDLYDKVRKLSENEIDFTMDTRSGEQNHQFEKYKTCLLSKTELWFYLPLALVIAAVIIVSNI